MQSVTVTGYDYRNLPTDIMNARDDFLRNVGEMIVAAIRRNIIDNGLYKTGELYNSIYYEIEGDSLTITSDVSYARIHEYGGRIYVTDDMRKVMHAKGVHIPDSQEFIHIPARPYIRPAIQEVESQIDAGVIGLRW